VPAPIYDKTISEKNRLLADVVSLFNESLLEELKKMK